MALAFVDTMMIMATIIHPCVLVRTPISTKRMILKGFNFLLYKIDRELHGRASHAFSLAGYLVLALTVLTAIPITAGLEEQNSIELKGCVCAQGVSCKREGNLPCWLFGGSEQYS